MESFLNFFSKLKCIYELVTKEQFISYNMELKQFELACSQYYPLGNDSFKIDHGTNYFGFFERLGEVHYFIIREKSTNKIFGTGCAILRNQSNPFWYLCDLKVLKEYRGHNTSFKLFINNFKTLIGKSNKGYLISMDPGSKQIKNIFERISKYLPVKINIEPKLLIYSVSKDVMSCCMPTLISHLGNLTYLSLDGVKDLILKSTSEKIPLYHVQHGMFADKEQSIDFQELPSECQIMFCLSEKNNIVLELEMKYGVRTDITATVISSGLHCDFILTSDI